jgi:hypothetical protein
MKPNSLILFSAGLLAASASGAYGDVVIYKFDDSSTAFKDDFYTTFGGLEVPQQTDGGLNDSGSLDYDGGGGTQAWFSTAKYSGIDVGDSVTASAYFFMNPSGATQVSSVKMGFTDDPDSTAANNAAPNSGNWIYFGNWSWDYEASVNTELRSSQGIVAATASLTGQNEASWYLQSITLEKASATAYDVNWSLDRVDSSGSLIENGTSGLRSNFTFSALGSDLYFYIGLENASSGAKYEAIDNLTMTGTGVTIVGSSVPEPSTYALIFGCLGLGLVLMGRRKQKASWITSKTRS